MTIQQAIDYLNLSVQEGYISQEEADRLLDLYWPDFVKKVSEMAERGDYYASEQSNK